MIIVKKVNDITCKGLSVVDEADAHEPACNTNNGVTILNYRVMQYLKFTCMLLALALTSCSQNNKYASWIAKVSSDTLHQNIETEANGNLPTSYKYASRVSKLLNLQNLDNSFDSIIIRIWYGYFHSDSLNIFEVKNENGKWESEVIMALPEFDTQDSLITVNYSKNNLQPKSGWNEFISKFFDTGIMTISHYKRDITSETMLAEGDGIGVEIATSKYYFYGHYPSPSIPSEEKNEVLKTLGGTLDLINNEFCIQSWKK